MNPQFSLALQSMLSITLQWVVVVVGVTIFGYPGVVLITPLAWLALPLVSGINYKNLAIANQMPPKALWGAVAGLMVGVVCSLLCAIVIQTKFAIDTSRPDEIEKHYNVLKFFVLTGLWVCPLISLLAAMATGGQKKK